MFEGFTLERVDVGEAELRVRHGGEGPPVLLLHGHPRTHTTWHRVAPQLARDHTVVCPDLRGYGESSKPETTEDHEPYSKRAMGRDFVALMRGLGHERFTVVGHDRGACAAYRTALDHPNSVSALLVWDSIPLLETLERVDAEFALSWWHWWFMGQTDKPAERMISADPEAYYKPNRELMGEENLADYLRAIHNPETVHAMCEEYRAGLGIDRAHDEADRAAGRKITCPVTIGWSLQDDMEQLYGDPLAIWRPWCEREPQGATADCGHHVAEEAPDEITAAIRRLVANAGA